MGESSKDTWQRSFLTGQTLKRMKAVGARDQEEHTEEVGAWIDPFIIQRQPEMALPSKGQGRKGSFLLAMFCRILCFCLLSDGQDLTR